MCSRNRQRGEERLPLLELPPNFAPSTAAEEMSSQKIGPRLTGSLPERPGPAAESAPALNFAPEDVKPTSSVLTKADA